MDANIFLNIYGNVDVTKAFTTISDNEDELSCVLKIHLLSERLLDAWISSTVGVEDLFENAKDERLKFRLTFALKLALAKKLDLPNEFVKCLQILNTRRNDFAHRYDCDPLSDADIEKMAAAIRSYPAPEKAIPIDEVKFQVFTKDGEPLAPFSFKSETTPRRIKLLIIYAAILVRIMAIVSRKAFPGDPLGFKY
ncbi:hypothetical protein [Serratia liquefaciens]|uniref:hypothetical protein n=1 Tax=Serratia liquefaciens TaxID=614 RepID=UPI0022B96071|nr:hypothetical protein [Serratia liquefaciens]